jgi:outer membrane receptor protein involved in Fe transport
MASYQNIMERRRYQKNGNVNRFEEEDKVKTFSVVADVASILTKNWTANSGIEYYHDIVNSRKAQINTTTNNIFYQRGLYADKATSANFSAYSLHHLKYGKWQIEVGLRYNIFSINIPDTFASSQKSGINITPSSLVTNLALLHHISQHQSVYSSFSTGYRAPNIDDMSSLGLVDFRYEIPAYGLKPEKTHNTEVGYRSISNKSQASAAFFYMYLSNLVTRVQVPGQQVNGYNVYTKQNSLGSFIRGVEMSFNQQLTKGLGLKTNASYTYGQNISGNEPMRRIPPLHARLAADYKIKHWNFTTESLFAAKQSRLGQGDKDDNRIPPGGTPGWNVLNIYAGYISDVLIIRTGLQNIFDEDYRTHGSGINGIGRSGWLSIQINL